MATLLAVTLGGAVGALGRYLLSTWAQGLGDNFPWGTLSVNLLGCFLMGVVVALLQRGTLPAEVQALATVGVLGSFTTFSAFSLETVRLLQEGDWDRALAYVGVSVVIGLGAVVAGMRLAGAPTAT